MITLDDDRLTPYIRRRIRLLPNGCWLWRGRLVYSAYPMMRPGEGMARQAVWRLINGPLAERTIMKAICGDTRCVCPNEGHMRPVAPGELHGPHKPYESILCEVDDFDHEAAEALDLARRRAMVERQGGDVRMVR